MNKYYYTPEEVMRIARVSNIETVYRWLRSGKLRGVKITRNLWRIPVDVLEDFLEGSRGDAPEESCRRKFHSS